MDHVAGCRHKRRGGAVIAGFGEVYHIGPRLGIDAAPANDAERNEPEKDGKGDGCCGHRSATAAGTRASTAKRAAAGAQRVEDNSAHEVDRQGCPCHRRCHIEEAIPRKDITDNTDNEREASNYTASKEDVGT